MNNRENARFETWMKEVDDLISAECEGLTSEDLPDQDYMDCFEHDMSPEDMAFEVLESLDI